MGRVGLTRFGGLPTTNAQAFTLIGAAKVSVTPTSGLPTASFSVDGTYAVQGGCPNPPLTFDFYWDSTNTSLWKTSVSTCDPKTFVWDTGPSRPIVVPGALATPGTHKILVAVFDATGAPAPNGAASTPYTVTSPPPPPSSPTPSPSPTPTTAPPPPPASTAPLPTPPAAPPPPRLRRRVSNWSGCVGDVARRLAARSAPRAARGAAWPGCNRRHDGLRPTSLPPRTGNTRPGCVAIAGLPVARRLKPRGGGPAPGIRRACARPCGRCRACRT